MGLNVRNQRLMINELLLFFSTLKMKSGGFKGLGRFPTSLRMGGLANLVLLGTKAQENATFQV